MILKGILLMVYPVIADLRSRQFCVFPVIIISILLSLIQLFCKDVTILDILMGVIPGMVIWLFSRWSRGAIGEGDAFVIGGLGMMIGWRSVCMVCLMACLMCACIGICLIIGRKAGRKTELPFIPFLAAAFIVDCCMKL